MGSRMRLTKGIIDGVALAKRRGLPYAMAARVAGVVPGTMAHWFSRGRQDVKDGKLHTLYAQLVAETEKANAELIEERLKNITGATGVRIVERTITTTTEGTGDAAKVTKVVKEKQEGGDWRADAWLLERVAPENFGTRLRVDAVVEDGAEEVDSMESLVRMAFTKPPKETP